MKRRAVIALALGMAPTGCAQGQSAQAPPAYAGGATLPPLHTTINAGLSPGKTRPARVAGPAAGPAPAIAFDALAGEAVGYAPLSPIQTAINAGLPRVDGSLQPSRASDVPATPRSVPAVVSREPAATGPAHPLRLPAGPEASGPATNPGTTPPAIVMPAMVSGTEGADPATPALDRSVATASSAEGPPSPPDEIGPGKVVGLTVATVDGEHITLAELVASVEDYRQTYLPDGQTLSNEQRDQLAGVVLQQLVDRTLLVQEAKRRLLTTEQKQKLFYEQADKQWQEQEIPKLCRKNDVSNEFELQEVLEKRGRSLELMRDSFRKAALAREFLHMQLQTRIALEDVPHRLRAYYREHPGEFHEPAQVTWREIVVEVGPDEGRAEARRRAEALLDRLRRGEAFNALAQNESNGPTASKGGLWETEPGASISAAVNEALERLPLRQVSPILEGPHGFHIVRVEGRRAAGPRPFAEVQGQIFAKLQEQAFQGAAEEYIRGLRERALVTSRFEGTASAPAAMRDDDARRASASSP